MARHTFNISFFAIFICAFSFIIYTFSDSIVLAFTAQQPALSQETKLPIRTCQQWTEQVRDFKVTKEDRANRVVVLNYHKIIDDDAINNTHYATKDELHSTIVLKSQFEKQMALLDKNHFTSLTTAEFELFMENKLDVPKNSVYITFDDGFKNTYEEAYPILKKYHFTAASFLITSHIAEKSTKFDPAGIQYLSLQDITNGCDIFDYQAHTYNLHKRHSDGQSILLKSSLDTLMDDFTINFQQLQKESPLFAYPYGEYNKTVIEVLEKLNVQFAFTTKLGDARPGQHPLQIPRKTILPTHTLDDFKALVNL